MFILEHLVQLHFYAHNLVIDETSPMVREGLWQLRQVLQGLPYLFWPQKAEKVLEGAEMSSNKEKQLSKLEGLQSLYNAWLKQDLQEKGFEAECLVREADKDTQKVDFARRVEDGKRLFIEVEFGNTASMDRNLLKLIDAYHYERSALGVMVLPVSSMGKSIASGVASFEATRARLKNLHPRTAPVPLLLLGLDPREAERYDLSQSQLPSPSCLSGNNNKALLWHVASELRAGVCIQDIALPDALRTKVMKRKVQARTKVVDRQPSLWA